MCGQKIFSVSRFSQSCPTPSALNSLPCPLGRNSEQQRQVLGSKRRPFKQTIPGPVIATSYFFCICGPLLFHLRLLIHNKKLKHRRRTTKLIWTTEQHMQTGNAEIDACAYVLPWCWSELDVGTVLRVVYFRYDACTWYNFSLGTTIFLPPDQPT